MGTLVGVLIGPALGPPKLRVIINHMGTPTLQVGQCHVVRL